MIWLLINGFLHIIYGVVLYIILFRNHFRYPIKYVYIGGTACTIICMTLPVLFFHINPNLEEWVMVYSFFFITFLVMLCLIYTNFSLYRILLVFFILGNYLDSITLFKESYGPLICQMFPTWDYQLQTVAIRLFGGVITFPFMIYFSLKMIRPIIDRPTSQPYFKYLWMTPACFFIMYRLCINPEEHRVFNVFRGAPILMFYVWVLGTFLITYSVLKMLADMMDKADVEHRLELSTLTNSMQMKQYEQMLHQIKETRTMRHDFRHHVVALKSYCEAKDYKRINEYLNTMNDNLELDTQIIFCENIMLNGILKYYYQMAKEQDIEFDINVSIPKTLNIQDEDLCVIAGNAVENAMEACGRQLSTNRFIRVRAHVFGEDAFTIQVENSYEGRITQTAQGAFLSSKRNEEGIGISSIKQICERYNGICNIKYTQHVFTISVLLNQIQS